MESRAVEAYKQVTGSSLVTTCGFFVHLGASPDRVVNTGSSTGLLEVKCLFKHRFSTIREACRDPMFCLEERNDKPHLKTNHPYYFQATGQIAVCERKWAHFSYTRKSIFT